MNAVVRWNPIRDFAAMQSAMDRIFDETWRGFREGVGENLPLNVYETESTYQVIAPVPGVDSESLNISFQDDVLTISAELKREIAPENGKTLMLERTFGKFTRSVRLPQAVVADEISAVLENGVLTLTLPKVPEAQPRQIPVRVHANPSAN